MGKFSKLAAKVDQAFVQEILSPFTGEVLKDKNGKAAFVEVYSADSQIGRQYDRDQRLAFNTKAKTGDIEIQDQFDANIAKCAALTKSWHLVDPTTLDPIDEPCTITAEESAEVESLPFTVPSLFVSIVAVAVTLCPAVSARRRSAKGQARVPLSARSAAPWSDRGASFAQPGSRDH